MATDSTSITGLYKNIYDSYVERQQNLKHRTIDECAKSRKQYSAKGKGFFGDINDYGNEAGGAQNETEAFRTIDNENYTQWKVTPKIVAWPIEFSGLSEALSDSDEAAFAEAVTDALDMAKERLLSDENRQFFGLGTGELTSASAATVASNITSFTVDSAQYLRRNQRVDIFEADGTTKTVDSIRIVDVDRVNNIVYMSTSLGNEIEDDFVIVKENIRDSAASDGKEMMGLRGIVDDGTDVQTFQNVDRSSNRIWKSVRIDASSANLTSDLLQRLLDDVDELSGEEPDLLVTHRKQRRKYLDIVVPQKRFQDGKLDAGHTELMFNGTHRMLLDKDCQQDTIYALNKKKLRKFEVKPLSMGGTRGSDKFLRTTNKDVFQAYWIHYCNFGTSQVNAHGKIVSLAKPNGLN